MRFFSIIIISFIFTIACDDSNPSDNTLFDFSVEPRHLNGTTGEEYTFMAVTDVDVSTVKFKWVFGDGTDTVEVFSDKYVTHVFDHPGNFIINVKMYDIETSTPFISARSYASIK